MPQNEVQQQKLAALGKALESQANQGAQKSPVKKKGSATEDLTTPAQSSQDANQKPEEGKTGESAGPAENGDAEGTEEQP